MQMAAEIGRIERLRVANVITEAESNKEKAKVKQLLDASVAAADAAARAAAGMAATPIAGPGVPVTGAGVALSTHTSEAQARRAWAGLRKAHPAELGSLKLSLKKIPRPHRPTHYQIVAGPLADQEAAVALCKTLRRKDLSCDAAIYSE
jgi:cell division septation protein DedD